MLTGPASALVVCLFVGVAVFRLVRDVGVPLLDRAITRHLAQVDLMMSRHTLEHERIIKSLDALNTKIAVNTSILSSTCAEVA